MNESFSVGLVTNSGPVPVTSVSLKDGIVLGGETSAWPRGIYMAFCPSNRVAEILYRGLRQVHDWGPGQFELQMSHVGDRLLFEGIDADSLPAAIWKTKFRIEGLKCRGFRRIELRKDGHTDIDLRVHPDRRGITVKPENLWPQAIRGIVDSSTLDGSGGVSWLRNSSARARRKACLSNILAITQSLGLNDAIEDVIMADVDRIYARVDADFAELVKQTGEFTAEGEPGHPTHRRLKTWVVETTSGTDEDYDVEDLRSFRQKTSPSLQIVTLPTATDLPHYAEFDVDLGNVYGLPGFFVHTAEVLIPGRTDHLKLRDRLRRKDDIQPHLIYDLA